MEAKIEIEVIDKDCIKIMNTTYYSEDYLLTQKERSYDEGYRKGQHIHTLDRTFSEEEINNINNSAIQEIEKFNNLLKILKGAKELLWDYATTGNLDKVKETFRLINYTIIKYEK